MPSNNAVSLDIAARLVNIDQVLRQLKSKIDNAGLKSLGDIKVNPQAGKELANLARAIAQSKPAFKEAAGSLEIFGNSLQKVATGLRGAAPILNAYAGAMKTATKAQVQLNKEQSRTADFANEFGKQTGIAARRFGGFLIARDIVSKLGLAFKEATNQAVGFEREIIRLAQFQNTTIKQAQQLGNFVGKLATEFGTSSQSLVKSAQILAQAGRSTGEIRSILSALTPATLTASFSSLEDATESLNALLGQFNIRASESTQVIDELNAVAEAFNVSIDELFDGLKRSGSAFAALAGVKEGITPGTQALREYAAIFTAVIDTTREGSDTIGTALKTILPRLQRGENQDFLRNFGIELLDSKKNFVGPLEAIKRISAAMQDLSSQSPQFAAIVEKLGGERQFNRVLPLLQETVKIQRALDIAAGASGSIAEDAALGQQALQVQLQKTLERFRELLRELTQSDTFKALAASFLGLANSAITLADSLKELVPLITTVATFQALRSIPPFSRGFARGAAFGLPKTFNKGGLVPSILTPGELVFSPEAVKREGISKLRQYNATGNIGGLKSMAGTYTVPGTGNSDSVKMNLEEGSFVIKKKSVEKSRQGFMFGGSVRRQMYASGGSTQQPPGPFSRLDYILNKLKLSLGIVDAKFSALPKSLKNLNDSLKIISKNANIRSGFFDTSSTSSVVGFSTPGAILQRTSNDATKVVKTYLHELAHATDADQLPNTIPEFAKEKVIQRYRQSILNDKSGEIAAAKAQAAAAKRGIVIPEDKLNEIRFGARDRKLRQLDRKFTEESFAGQINSGRLLETPAQQKAVLDRLKSAKSRTEVKNILGALATQSGRGIALSTLPPQFQGTSQGFQRSFIRIQDEFLTAGRKAGLSFDKIEKVWLQLAREAPDLATLRQRALDGSVLPIRLNTKDPNSPVSDVRLNNLAAANVAGTKAANRAERRAAKRRKKTERTDVTLGFAEVEGVALSKAALDRISGEIANAPITARPNLTKRQAATERRRQQLQVADFQNINRVAEFGVDITGRDADSLKARRAGGDRYLRTVAEAGGGRGVPGPRGFSFGRLISADNWWNGDSKDPPVPPNGPPDDPNNPRSGRGRFRSFARGLLGSVSGKSITEAGFGRIQAASFALSLGGGYLATQSQSKGGQIAGGALAGAGAGLQASLLTGNPIAIALATFGGALSGASAAAVKFEKDLQSAADDKAVRDFVAGKISLGQIGSQFSKSVAFDPTFQKTDVLNLPLATSLVGGGLLQAGGRLINNNLSSQAEKDAFGRASGFRQAFSALTLNGFGGRFSSLDAKNIAAEQGTTEVNELRNKFSGATEVQLDKIRTNVLNKLQRGQTVGDKDIKALVRQFTSDPASANLLALANPRLKDTRPLQNEEGRQVLAEEVTVDLVKELVKANTPLSNLRKKMAELARDANLLTEGFTSVEQSLFLLKEVASQFDTQISATLDRVGGGNSISPEVLTNIFSSPQGASVGAFNDSILKLQDRLGLKDNVGFNNIAAAASLSNAIRVELPRRLINGSATGGLNSNVSDFLRQQVGNTGNSTLDNYVRGVISTSFTGDSDLPLAGLNEEEISQITEKLASELDRSKGILAEANDQLNAQQQRSAQQAVAIANANQGIVRQQLSINQLNERRAVTASEILGVRSPLADRNRAMGAIRGDLSTIVGSQITNLSDLTGPLAAINREGVNASNVDQYTRLTEALKLLSTDTRVLDATMQKNNELNQAQQASRSLADRLLGGGPQEVLKFNQQLKDFQTIAAGGDVGGPRTLEALNNMEQLLQNFTPEQFENLTGFSRDEGEQALRDIRGEQFQRLAPGQAGAIIAGNIRGDGRADLVKEANQAFETMKQASEILKQQSQLQLQTAVEQMATQQATFTEGIKVAFDQAFSSQGSLELQKALNKFSETFGGEGASVNLTGKTDVVVSFNGANGVFKGIEKDLEGAISRIVNEQIKVALGGGNNKAGIQGANSP